MDSYLTVYIKSNSKYIIDLSVRVKNLKLVEENTGYSLCDLELNKAFLDTTPKAQSMKEKNDKLGFSKIKIFALQKTTIRK